MPLPFLPRTARGVARLLPALLLLGAACARDEITAPEPALQGALTVDASAAPVYLSLSEAGTVTVADPAASTGWDLALQATNVTLNGGAAGPGGVTGYCLCQNSAANPSAAEILAMTPASELADFTAVTAASAPAAASFQADELVPAIAGWYTGSGAAATAAPDAAWLVRLRDGEGYAKLRVTALQDPTAATPGRVTLEYAVQPSADAALGEVRTLAVDVPADAPVAVDLLGGATTTSGSDWDLRLDGWTVRLNGGVSGAGEAAAAMASEPFAQIATAATDPRAYRADAHAGVFAAHPWYRYDLAGDHAISPTFDVYLLRRGGQLYKVRLTGYYGPAGEPRYISVQFERIAG
jgi:hypothetical protein